MSAPNDLITLMYVASRTDHRLSGEVREKREAGSVREYSVGTLLVGVGGQFRTELSYEDGDTVLQVCDGRSLWTVGALGGNRIEWRGGRIQFYKLLVPAWVLANYDIELVGRITHMGREAYVINGLRRATSRYRRNDAWSGDCLEALVDTDLGIILSYKVTGIKVRMDFAEFTSLRIDPQEAKDPKSFSRPDNIEFHDAGEPAAPALSPSRRSNSYPAVLSPMPLDALASAIYRAASVPQPFAAQVHETVNGEVVANILRDIGASTSIPLARGVAAYKAKHLSRSGEFSGSLIAALPMNYLIEASADPNGKITKIVYNGARGVPPAAGLALLVDLSWLLDGYGLSVSEIEDFGGRGVWKVSAEPGEEVAAIGRGVLSDTSVSADRVDAVVDARLGVALRLEWSYRGRAALVTELSDVSESVDVSAFDAETPDVPRAGRDGLREIHPKDIVKRLLRSLRRD